MAKEIRDILYNSLREIEGCMYKKLKDKVWVYEEEFYEQRWFSVIQEEIDRIQWEIGILNWKLRELENQKSNLNKQVTASQDICQIIESFPREAISRMYWTTQKELSIYVAEKIKEDKEYLNYISWAEIKRWYEQTFSLAATAKEKRNIVLKLYSINRNELWINIPPSFLEKTNVTIANWKIQTIALPNK